MRIVLDTPKWIPIVFSISKQRMSSNSSSQEESIQVMVRIRPSPGSIIIADPLLGRQLQIPCSSSSYAISKTFTFDKVVGPLVDNKLVFQQVRPLIDEVLNGFNATILAYGQSGTGKTHTILGHTELVNARLDVNAGIIPRAIHYIFDLLENKKSDIIDFSIRISYLELYNEDLRDLLVDNNESLKIFEENKKILVQNAEEMPVRNIHHCLEMVQLASEKRQTSATFCNEKSSRSHTIFIMQVLQREVVNGKEIIRLGKLNLVDLAGSESVGKSGVEKKGQREAGLINQSLLTLGRVINALVDKNSHVPYRESKLTRLLKDSLGGHTKTTLIATVSGDKHSLDETLSTLDYSHRAKNIKVRPQINQRITKQELLKGYLGEIETLKRELSASRHKNGVYLPEDQYATLVSEHESITNKNLILNNQIESYEATILQLQSTIESDADKINSLEIQNSELLQNAEHYKSKYHNSHLNFTSLQVSHHNANQQINNLSQLLTDNHSKHKNTFNLLEMINSHQKQMYDIHMTNTNAVNTYKLESSSKLAHTNDSLIQSNILSDYLSNALNQLKKQLQDTLTQSTQDMTNKYHDLANNNRVIDDLLNISIIPLFDVKPIMTLFQSTLNTINDNTTILVNELNHNINQHVINVNEEFVQMQSTHLNQITTTQDQIEQLNRVFTASILELNQEMEQKIQNLQQTLEQQHQHQKGLHLGELSAVQTAIQNAYEMIKNSVVDSFGKMDHQVTTTYNENSRDILVIKDIMRNNALHEQQNENTMTTMALLGSMETEFNKSASNAIKTLNMDVKQPNTIKLDDSKWFNSMGDVYNEYKYGILIIM